MNNKVLAYAAFVAYIAAVYVNPMWIAIWTIAALIALPVLTQIVNDVFPIEPVYVTPAPRMFDYYEAFSVEPEEVEEEQHSDVWGLDVDTCEFACPITVVAPVQLLLPATVETVKVIDFTTFTYKELQAMVKALRRNVKDIKLTAKKQVLIEYLKANY